jgi:hypothetical protein
MCAYDHVHAWSTALAQRGLNRGLDISGDLRSAQLRSGAGKAPDEIDWSAPERQPRAVAKFVAAGQAADRAGLVPAGDAWPESAGGFGLYAALHHLHVHGDIVCCDATGRTEIFLQQQNLSNWATIGNAYFALGF